MTEIKDTSTQLAQPVDDPQPKKKGRPLGSKNKPKIKRSRGRPVGSKTKRKPRRTPEQIEADKIATAKLRAEKAAAKEAEKAAKAEAARLAAQDEQLELQEALRPETPEKKRGRGREKSSRFVPYEEAQSIVQREMISSVVKYYKWWERNRPEHLPHFPYRVYKEWTSWNDFLGVHNLFEGARVKVWRNFDEASRWAQTIGIRTYDEWMQYVKVNKIPDDIPKRPDLTYAAWAGWARWFGKSPVAKIEAAQKANRVIYYIIHPKWAPSNVFEFGIEPNGVSGMHEKWQAQPYDLVKAFWFDREYEEKIANLVLTNTTPYLDDESVRITHNVWSIAYTLEQVLEVVK